jgi:DHA1 family bicyclomycin/chloramphenicol resistance-like MFS transporter
MVFCCVAAALLALRPVQPASLVPIVVAIMLCRGLASPNMTHAALEPLPAIAGVVSAVLGFTQMAAGSVVSAVVGALYPALGPLAVALAMAVCALAALAVGIWANAD